MQITLLKSKLHRTIVTSVFSRLLRSLSIDRNLMEAAGFLNNEKILVGNITNEKGLKPIVFLLLQVPEIALNGAAAHKETR